MPRISDILRSKFPYPPTMGQERFFCELDDLIGLAGDQHDIMLVRGYAGTGKTTVISSLVQVLPLFNYRFVLLAPTGRAAKVIAGYSGKQAHTIHKIIYRQVADPKSGDLKFVRQKNYFKKTVFVVDEASMINDEGGIFNSGLLSDLVEYIFEHSTNKLILIGDNAQLPPVGSLQSPALDGAYLDQKFGFQPQQVVLEEVLRQEENSGILINATCLRRSVFSPDQVITFKTTSFGDIFRMTNERLEDGIRYAIDKYSTEDMVVICRANWQAVRYNEYIRRNILFREEEIEAGDLIMVVKNNYTVLEADSAAGFIANGEFAEVRKIITFEEQYGFRFAILDLQLIDYPEMEPFRARVILDTLHSNTPSLTRQENQKLYFDVLENYKGLGSKKKIKEAVQQDEYLNALQIKFAYALTCHKAQGGQWSIVFVDEGGRRKDESEEAHKRWLYTAITRAQKEVYLLNFDADYFDNP